MRHSLLSVLFSPFLTLWPQKDLRHIHNPSLFVVFPVLVSSSSPPSSISTSPNQLDATFSRTSFRFSFQQLFCYTSFGHPFHIPSQLAFLTKDTSSRSSFNLILFSVISYPPPTILTIPSVQAFISQQRYSCFVFSKSDFGIFIRSYFY